MCVKTRKVAQTSTFTDDLHLNALRCNETINYRQIVQSKSFNCFKKTWLIYCYTFFDEFLVTNLHHFECFQKRNENNFQKIISQSRDRSNSNRQFHYNNKPCSKKTWSFTHEALPDFLSFRESCSYQKLPLVLHWAFKENRKW